MGWLDTKRRPKLLISLGKAPRKTDLFPRLFPLSAWDVLRPSATTFSRSCSSIAMTLSRPGAGPSTMAGSPDLAASYGRSGGAPMALRRPATNRPMPATMSSISDVETVMRCPTLYVMSPDSLT